jgi:hypothetical protein
LDSFGGKEQYLESHLRLHQNINSENIFYEED